MNSSENARAISSPGGPPGRAWAVEEVAQLWRERRSDLTVEDSRFGAAADQRERARLAAVAQIVACDRGAVGPADEHQPVKREALSNSTNVTGPRAAVVLTAHGPAGIAVTPVVHGEHSHRPGQRAGITYSHTRLLDAWPCGSSIGITSGARATRTDSTTPPWPDTCVRTIVPASPVFVMLLV